MDPIGTLDFFSINEPINIDENSREPGNRPMCVLQIINCGGNAIEIKITTSKHDITPEILQIIECNYVELCENFHRKDSEAVNNFISALTAEGVFVCFYASTDPFEPDN